MTKHKDKEESGGSMLEHAIKYARLGWSVIPLKAKDKRPIVKWKKRQTNRATEDEIRGWWKRYPNANIGIVTGKISGFDVVDLDGPNAQELLESEIGVSLPQSLRQKTGRTEGGLQIFLQYHGGGLKTKAGCLSDGNGNGVDLKTDKGIAVVPPSIHPSGRRYEWIEKPTNDLANIAAWPSELIELLTPKKSDRKKNKIKWTEVAKGERNIKLTRAVGRLVKHRGVSCEHVLEIAIGMNITYKPPLPDSEVARIVKSIWEREHCSKEKVLNAASQGQQGVANLLISISKDEYAYDHSAAKWYYWGGHHWAEDQIELHLQNLDHVQEEFTSAAACLSQQIIASDNPIETELENGRLHQLKTSCLSQVKKLQTLAYRKQVTEFAAQGEGSLGISGNEWDQHPWLLACPDCIINLTTGEMSDGVPGQYMKTYCPTKYDPNAECPRFVLFLEEIFGDDQQLIDFIQRVLGMSLVGEQIEHVLIILWGKGRNGKDTLMEAIAYTLGKMASHARPEILIESGFARAAGAPDSAAMQLQGKRFIYTSETSENAKFNASVVKALTGGGKVTARAPYGKREVEFSPSHTLFMMTNHKPHASTGDYAFWKRMILMPFEQSFVSEPKEEWERLADPKLPQKLKDEAPGILRWMVKGCLQWQEKGLYPPERVKRAVEEYRSSEDRLSQFIKEYCDVEGEAVEASKKLHEAYLEWCGDNGVGRVMSLTKFGIEMGKMFGRKRVRTGTVITGVCLRKE